MGQRVEILPNHGDDSSVRRQHDQCHLEAGGGSSVANSGVAEACHGHPRRDQVLVGQHPVLATP